MRASPRAKKQRPTHEIDRGTLSPAPASISRERFVELWRERTRRHGHDLTHNTHPFQGCDAPTLVADSMTTVGFNCRDYRFYLMVLAPKAAVS
jgi:hypothetical protein